ncbi:MAG TPA: hypothetical protein VF457_04295 [Burkholderiaceae bacterium]
MRLNRWLLRTPVVVALALVAVACIAAFQLPWSPAASAHFTRLAGAPPFDERVAGYSLSGVLAAFARLGPQGLAGYEAYRAVDLVFPWALCGLVAAVMLRLDAARATMWPWLAAIADTAENLAQYRILLTRDELSPELVPVASALTQIKWGLYVAMLLMLLAVGVRFLWREQRRATGRGR